MKVLDVDELQKRFNAPKEFCESLIKHLDELNMVLIDKHVVDEFLKIEDDLK